MNPTHRKQQEIPHILAGIAIPVNRWKEAELDITKIKQKYGLENTKKPNC